MFVISYLVQYISIERTQALTIVMIAALLMCPFILIAGRLADRYGRGMVYGVSSLLCGLSIFPSFWLMEGSGGSLFLIALAIIIPIVIGLVLGVAGVLGLLTGGLAAGFTLAVFMSNSGGAWDNAKKMIEEGNFGGKGSEDHKATIVGDTVGDPFKDTSGPSLNILIKLMSMVSIVMAGLTIAFL